ncbi:hypothetical protein AAG906_018004 [Vitis piasezkii]
MIPNERFNLSTHISSLEFAKGHVLVLDPWSGLSKGSDRVFTLQRSLEITSKLCLYHFILSCYYSILVEKASFAHLNNLFEIDAAKRTHNVLISDKNLQALIKNPKPFIIPVRSSCPKKKKNHVARHVLNARILSPAIPSSLFSSYSLFSLSSNDEVELGVNWLVLPIIWELFQAMQRIPIKVDEDPNQSFIARLPYGTPNTTIARIIHMKDYTAFEIAEVPKFVTSCSSERTSSNDWKQLKP